MPGGVRRDAARRFKGWPEAGLPLRAGIASSIGSVPHTDVVDAVDFVLTHSPELPAAPQMPNRGPEHTMTGQWLAGLPGVTLLEGGRVTVERDEFSVPAGAGIDLDEPRHDGLITFLRAVSDRAGPIKVQVTGPITLGSALAAGGLPRRSAAAAGAQIARAGVAATVARVRSELGPDVPLVLFLDEPGLVEVVHPRFSPARRQLAGLLRRAMSVADDEVITGIHCCGATDWQIVTAARPDIVSVPEPVLADSDLRPIGAHLDDGGWIAWGAVPTGGPMGTEGGAAWESLAGRLCDLARVGVDPVRLRTQSMITPACGLAGHGESQAVRMLELTARLGARLRDEAAATRFAVGA